MSQPFFIEKIKNEDIGSLRDFLSEQQRFDHLSELVPQVFFETGKDLVVPYSLKLVSNACIAGVCAGAGKFLRLLIVDQEQRSKGHGAKLLNRFEDMAQSGGHKSVQTMAEPGNYISPGIDVRYGKTIEWLKRRGYSEKTRNQNIFVDVAENESVTNQNLIKRQSKCNGYTFERLSLGKLPFWQKFIEKHFSKGWAFEVGLAVQRNTPSGVHVAYDAHGAPAAFAAHDGNNTGLGWFGPTGTLEEHRGKGLAAALLIACLLDVKANGHKRCEIAWIGPRKFYEKVAGVSGERNFVVLEKKLSKGV